VQLAWKLGVVALVALVLLLLPGGGAALEVTLALLTIAFFAAIAFLGYRLFRQYRFELDSLTDRQRLVLYASLGAALVTLTATNRLFDVGGGGVVAWFALLGLSSYGLFWVWMRYRQWQ
jgi:hypothetical protein